MSPSRLEPFYRLLPVLLLVLSGRVAATEIPPALQAWEDWVLKGHETSTCPFLYRQDNQRFCVWPGRLSLEVGEGAAQFRQEWEVFAESDVHLPGDGDNWPQAVKVGQSPGLVVEKQGRPVIRLERGQHAVSGRLEWARAPKFLQLPDGVVLVDLQVNGKAALPELDAQGRLWLGRKTGSQEARAARDTHAVRVFRRLADDIPRVLETQVMLQVSGADRELRMRPALLPGFAPQHLQSPLPARIEPDGSLRVQVRPGQWQITLLARQTDGAETFRLPPPDGGWPAQEVWSFEAYRHLRSVEIGGVAGIDPQQTAMPEHWKGLPAYLLDAGSELALKELHRGDTDPAPDEISVERRLLLDFDGSGYTVEDHLGGTLNRDRRLSMAAGYALGRAELNGQPQLITQMEAGGAAGLELRQGHLDLLTVSRAVRAPELAAGGWNTGFRSARATLQVPPGWEVFSIEGADRAHPTWISRWSLWDIFLVLIIGAAFARLYNLRIGALALVGVVLAYHQQGAPLLIWLNLAGVIALLRLVPASRVRSLLLFYRNISLLALLVIALPWSVDEVRKAIYPQLERPWQVVRPATESPHAPQPEIAMQAEPGIDMPAESRVRRLGKQAREYMGSGAVSTMALEDKVADPTRGYDAGALIQTGPGMPSWQWRQVSISWNGPLEAGETLRIRYLPPALVRVQRLVTVLLFALLGLVLVLHEFRRGGRWTLGDTGGAGAAAAVLAGAMLLTPAVVPPVHAGEFPPPEYLDELRKRLLEPAQCLPACADVPAARIRVVDDVLEMQLDVIASERVAVPVPHDREGALQPGWQQVDDRRAVPLRVLRDARQVPHVLLAAGAQRLQLRVPLQELETVSLDFPLRPRAVTVQAPGWRVAGVREERLQAGSVSLERIQREVVKRDVKDELLPDPPPPFLRVERTLSLRDEWRLHTRVVRVAPEQGAVHATIPVWAGERVTTPGVAVEDGRVRVALGARQRVFNWQSIIDPVPGLAVKAAETDRWVERWRVESDTRWHLDHSGLAPVLEGGARRPGLTTWQPWPGEELLLSVTKPRALQGPTRTIESVRVLHTPGQRSSETRMHLQLRTSQGGDYEFRLPDGATLQSLTVDGATQILPQQRDQVRIPLHPGTVQAEVVWQQAGEPAAVTTTPTLHLKHPVANVNLELHMPADRWLLFTGGPQIGPAVLFWGLLVVVILAAAALGRVGGTPLKTWHWILLGSAMLATETIAGALFVVGWFHLMAKRATMNIDMRRDYFNLMQIGLALLSLLAVATLLGSIPAGLLSRPDMQIVGNGSGGQVLRWYQDFSGPDLPAGWVMSVPMWVYRVTMLAWSLWLATAMLHWLRWAWGCYSSGGLWRRKLVTASSAGEDIAVAAVEAQPGKKEDPDAGGQRP